MNLPLHSIGRAHYNNFSSEPFKHNGLWHDKFFDQHSDGFGKLPQGAATAWIEKSWPQEKVDDQQQVKHQRKVGDKQQLDHTHARLRAVWSNLGGAHRDLGTEWHMAIGMGNPHPLENGATWHHTLAVPYVPASAVKGLLNAWLRWWCGDDDIADAWLGTGSGVGRLVFFDALPVGPVMIGEDVMTPHQGTWYERGGSESATDSDAPGDWHNPNPISFLVIKKATFRLVCMPRLPGDQALVGQALDQLESAFQHLGGGAKTGSGYGRLLKPQPEGTG